MASVKKRRKGVVLELTARGGRVAAERSRPSSHRSSREVRRRTREPIRSATGLFPRAYLDPTEEDAEHNWQDMVHSDLVAEKSAALASLAETLERVADADRDAKLTLDRRRRPRRGSPRSTTPAWRWA